MPKQMIEVEVPEGYQVLSWRGHREGDIFCGSDGSITSDYPLRLFLNLDEIENPMTEETQEKPTVTVDCEIPEGFELQGEFRIPKEDDWFLSSGGNPMRFNRQYNPRLILKKKPVLQEVTLKLAPPEGFRFTGEYRTPEVGDWYVSTLDVSQAIRHIGVEVIKYVRFILEKVDA